MKKILLFILSLLGIAGSVCIFSLFFYVPLLTEELKLYLELYPWLNTAFAVYSVFTCVCYLLLLIIAIFMQKKLSAIKVKNQSGSLQFSKQSLESTIRYSYSDIEDIKFHKIRVRLNRNPEKIKIHVRLFLKEPNRLMGLTSEIQDKIESAIKASLGITIKFIHLEVVEVASNNDVPDEKTKSARVV